MNKGEKFVIIACLLFVCAIFILANVVSAEITGKAIASTSSPRVSSLSKSAVATSPAGVAAASVKKAVSSAGNSAAKAKLNNVVDFRGYKYFADDSGKRSNIYASTKGIIYLQRPSFGGVATDYFWPDKKIGNVSAAPAGNFINLEDSAEKTIGIDSFDQLNGMKIEDNGKIVSPSASKELKVSGANGKEIPTGMTVDGQGYIHPDGNPSETIGIMDKNGKITMYDPSTYSDATKEKLGSVANLIQNTQAKNGLISSLDPVKTGGYANSSTVTNPSKIISTPTPGTSPGTSPGTAVKPGTTTPTTPGIVTKPVTTPTTPSTSCMGLCDAQYGRISTMDVTTTNTKTANYNACAARCSGTSGTSSPSYPGSTSPYYPGTNPTYPVTKPGTTHPSNPSTTSPGSTSPGTTTPGSKTPGTEKPGTTTPTTPTTPTKPGTETKPISSTSTNEIISCPNGPSVCPDEKPICEPTKKVCVACMGDGYSICGVGQKCTNEVCVEGCFDDTNCYTSAPVCDPVKKICVASVSATGGCTASDGTPLDNGEFLLNIDCPNNEDKVYTETCKDGKITDDKVERCGASAGKCISDSECKSKDTPRCDLNTGKCTACTTEISDSSCKKFSGTVCYQGKCAEGCGGVSRLLPIGAYDLSEDGTTCYKCNGGDNYEKVDALQCAKSATGKECSLMAGGIVIGTLKDGEAMPQLNPTTQISECFVCSNGELKKQSSSLLCAPSGCMPAKETSSKSMIFALVAPFTQFMSTITGNVVDENSVSDAPASCSIEDRKCIDDAQCEYWFGPEGQYDQSGYIYCNENEKCSNEPSLGCDKENNGNYMCAFGEVCLDDGSCTAGCDSNEDCDKNSNEPICDSTLGDYGTCVGCSVEEECDGGVCNPDGSCNNGDQSECATTDDCPFDYYCTSAGICEIGCEKISSSAWGTDCLEGFVCDAVDENPGTCVEDNGENGYCGDGECDWDSDNEVYEDAISCPSDCSCYSDEECDWYQTCGGDGKCQDGECNQDNGASDYCVSNYGSGYTCNEYTGSCESSGGDEGCWDGEDYYGYGDPYWDWCDDGLSKYIWGTCLGGNQWDDSDNWISYEEYCSGNDGTNSGSGCIDECDSAYVEYGCEDGSESGECYEGNDGCFHWVDYPCYTD